MIQPVARSTKNREKILQIHADSALDDLDKQYGGVFARSWDDASSFMELAWVNNRWHVGYLHQLLGLESFMRRKDAISFLLQQQFTFLVAIFLIRSDGTRHYFWRHPLFQEE